MLGVCRLVTRVARRVTPKQKPLLETGAFVIALLSRRGGACRARTLLWSDHSFRADFLVEVFAGHQA